MNKKKRKKGEKNETHLDNLIIVFFLEILFAKP